MCVCIPKFLLGFSLLIGRVVSFPVDFGRERLLIRVGELVLLLAIVLLRQRF